MGLLFRIAEPIGGALPFSPPLPPSYLSVPFRAYGTVSWLLDCRQPPGAITIRLPALNPALLLLLLGFLLAAGMAFRQHGQNELAVGTQLSLRTDEVATDLRKRIQLYEYGLRGAGALVMGAGGEAQLTRRRFREYAESREFAREFPGARAFGLIRRVPPGTEAAFVTRSRADGAPEFSIRQLSPHAGEKFVIVYIEPQENNEAAVGLDVASERNRRMALMAAANTGRPTLTGPITLVQAGKPQHSMLFVLPVQLERPGHHAAADRGINADAWVYAPLVTDEILADFELSRSNYGFVLTDVTDHASPQQVFANRRGGTIDSGQRRQSRTFPVYGRLWRVDVVAHPEFIAGLRLVAPLQVAAPMAAIALLLAALLQLYLASMDRKRRAGAQRARLAAIVENSPDAIIAMGLDGRVTEWNEGAERILGYAPADAIGRALVELIVPFERVREDASILERVARGGYVAAAETLRRHRDGTPLDVEVSASPIRDERGAVTGVAAVLRDISERKQAQASILKLNATLEQQVERRTAEVRAYSVLQRAILANAGYAIIATEIDGTITVFNPAAESILGYSAEEVVGVTNPGIFHDPIEVAERAHLLAAHYQRDIPPGFEVFIAKAREGEPDANEWTYITKQGQRIPVLLNVSALRQEDGELLGYLGIAVDLRERQLRQAALETSERKLRGLFELSPLGIALTDESGAVVEFNESFRALTGYDAGELATLDYWTLTPREYEPTERAVSRTIERTGRYGPYEKHYDRKDGVRIPVRLNGVSLQLGGKPFLWSIVEDISAQRHAEAVLVDAVASAEAASQAKSNFLANMSHEIRTPMNAILGMLQLLDRSHLDARQQDYATKTQLAARTLLGILNDILDFSKIEAGRQSLDTHRFELDQLLRDIGVILGASVGAKDVEVVFDLAGDVPAFVIGDSLRLQQILINLAGNAIKFTQAGEVVLVVRLVEKSAARAILGFEVRDTGIGIAADKLAVIFEGFAQAEASTNRRFGGTGLGLAISQKLVRLMGGELDVESEPGRGSRFHFTIQVDLPEDGAPAARTPLAQPLDDLRLLVVDDNDCAREVMVAMARSLHWHADAAASGEHALVLIEQAQLAGRPYQAVLLDWRMPGIDGWETGQRIRNMRIQVQAPVIVMVTAHSRELLAERSEHERASLDGFLVKPVTSAMLLDAVADAFSGHSMRGNAVVRVSRETRLSAMSVLVVEDNPTNQQVVTELLETEGACITIADGGAVALAILIDPSNRFDAVLMDIQMPDMDGYTATRRIRAVPELRDLPIIAMTANVLPSDREACLAAGMNDHIGKPFDLDDLVQRLTLWTGGAPGVAAQSQLPAPAAAGQPLDWRAALARFGQNTRAYANVLECFGGEAERLLAETDAARQNNRHEDAARHLHTLRGIAATVGAGRLASAVAAQEAVTRTPSTGGTDNVALGGIRAEVAAASDFAAELFATLAKDLEHAQPRPKPPAPGDLRELASLLDTANLRALDAFGALAADLSGSHPAEHRKIERALASLDFATAATACRELVETYE